MAFDPFGDHATRGYLRNVAGELDPERVKRLEHRSFSANILTALKNLQGVRHLSYQDVLDTHRTLFGAVYPWAGQDRARLAPDLAIGKGGRYDMFAHPGDVRRAVEYGLEMGRDPTSMRTRSGEVFGTLAYGHPFLDGNGRSLMTVHAELARRAGFHIAWQDIGKAEFLSALTEELRKPNGQLDRLLVSHIVTGPLPLRETATRLSADPGLNPTGPASGRSTSPGF
jgi:cell filamentation protein